MKSFDDLLNAATCDPGFPGQASPGPCALFDLDESRYGLLASETGPQSGEAACGRNTGYAAMMRAVSQVVSRAGIARYALVSAGMPGGGGGSVIRELMTGAAEAAEAAGVEILGGTACEYAALQIIVTLYGESEKKRRDRISGAKPGDIIYITGWPGDAGAGAELIASGNREKEALFPRLVDRNRRPLARFDIMPGILDLFAPTAMSDINGSLVRALEKICKEHGCGFEIDAARIPISAELGKYAVSTGKASGDYTLNASGDLELLITTPRDLTETMNVTVNNIPVTPIGKIIGKGFYITGKDRTGTACRERL